MADRVEIFDVTCPASTAATAPIEVATRFNPGLVEAVWVVIPDGHSGLTGIALAVAHQPTIPQNIKLAPGEAWRFIEGNDESIKFDLDNYPDSGAWSVWLFNADLNPHKWQLRFEVNELPPAQPAAGVSASTVVAVGSLGGAPPSGEGEGEGTPEPPSAPGEPSPPPETPPPPETEPPPEAGPPPETPGPPEPIGPPPEEVAPPELAEPPPEPIGAEPTEPEGEGEGEGTPAAGAEPKPKRPGKRPPAPRARSRVVTTYETRPAGGWLPHGARFTVKQTDQGQDFITGWRGLVIAPDAGYVVRVLADRPFPAGFGPHYAVVHIDSGRFGGRDWYIGHATALVKAGERFGQGHALARADQGAREGGGWVELGPAPGGYPGPMGGGAAIAGLFGPLTIARHHTVTEHPHRRAPAPRGPSKPAHRRAPAPAKRPPGARRGPPTSRRAPAPARHPAGPPRPSGAPHGPAPAPRRAPAPAARPAPPPPPRYSPPPPPRPAPRAAPPPPKPRRHK